jgi:hypothetical protein
MVKNPTDSGFADANYDVNLHGHAEIGHGFTSPASLCVADENLKATSKSE